MMTGNGPPPAGRCTSVASRTPSRMGTMMVVTGISMLPERLMDEVG